MYIPGVAEALLSASSWLGHQQQVIDGQQQQDVIAANAATDFDWDEIPAHKHFEWHPCFGDFQCARLQVPMDWQGHSTERDKTVEIAVIRLEATVPITDKRHGGCVIFNPGGPGGSGVEQIQKGGHHFRAVISASPDANDTSAKFYDVIGFDPRGLGGTRPLVSSFPDLDAAIAYSTTQKAYGWLNTSNVAFDNIWASTRAVADSTSRLGIENGIAKHVSTAPVARDIIEIVEQYGEWRERETHRMIPTSELSARERALIMQRAAYHKNKGLVNYWGFSYGTILGATLAALFPDRVGRLVLDGVADSLDYMAGGWSTNLRDTDRQIGLFADYCFQGGPEDCPVYDPAGPEAIVFNIEQSINRLKAEPITVPGSRSHSPKVLTYNDLQWAFRVVVYIPLWGFAQLAQVFAGLHEGNGQALLEVKRRMEPSMHARSNTACLQDGPYSLACAKQLGESTLENGPSNAITCSAALARLYQTKAEYKAYAETIAAQSSLIGEWWSTIMLDCTAWHARPAWRYAGDFRTTPANPILFVGNTVDPVTPLFNAFKMAGLFAGSGVLHQNSEGHCSYSSVSLCSARAIRHYFQTGQLPGTTGGLRAFDGPGAFCEPDLLPLSGYTQDSQALPPRGEDDVELWDALVGLNQAFW